MFRVGLVALVLLCLMFASIASQTVESQSHEALAPIDKKAVTEFATTFLSSYNALIVAQYTRSADPNILRYFTLYEATGYSFNVTVMWPGYGSTKFLDFVFVPIMSSSPTPRVTVISNTTFGCLYVFCENETERIIPNNDYGVALDNSVGVGPNGIITLPFYIMFYSAPLFADPQGFATGATNWYFGINQKNIPTPATPPWWQSLWDSVVFWVFVVIAGAVTIVAFILELQERRERRRSGKPSKRKSKTKKNKGGR